MRKIITTFDGPIADFALPPDAQGVFQGVMGLALFEPNLGTALYVGIKQALSHGLFVGLIYGCF